MNIFFLSREPKLCAEFLGDRHCVKMVLETAQMLSTAHRMCGGSTEVYGAFAPNHPMSKWVRRTRANYRWTLALFRAMMDEFDYRLAYRHASGRLTKHLKEIPPAIPVGELTDPPQCMPDEFRHPDAVVAYRRYYAEKYRQGIVAYGWNRAMPEWLKVLVES